MPNNGAGGGSVSGSSIAVDSDEAHEIVEAMHAEIELLMLSGNYSREVAVRMLLNKVAKERALKQQQHAGSLVRIKKPMFIPCQPIFSCFIFFFVAEFGP